MSRGSSVRMTLVPRMLTWRYCLAGARAVKAGNAAGGRPGGGRSGTLAELAMAE